MLKVKIKKLYKDVRFPDYAHPGDAGMDLYSRETYELQPGERYNFKVGFALEFSEGYVAVIKDKSGLSVNYGLHTIGGVFDAGFRGEYNVTLINLSQKSYPIKKGDKLAQLVIVPCAQVEFEEAQKLSESSRGEGKFGSTGRA